MAIKNMKGKERSVVEHWAEELLHWMRRNSAAGRPRSHPEASTRSEVVGTATSSLSLSHSFLFLSSSTLLLPPPPPLGCLSANRKMNPKFTKK